MHYRKRLSEAEIEAILLRAGKMSSLAIRDRYAAETGWHLSLGTLHVTLDRMQQRGVLLRRDGEATAKRGGFARVYFRVAR